MKGRFFAFARMKDGFGSTACGPSDRFSQHRGGYVYTDGDAAVEVGAEAAGIQSCGAAQVEVAAAADGTDETFDDLQLPLVREGLAGEQAEGADAPEGLVAASGARQEVGEVGEIVRTGARFQEIQVPVFDPVSFACRPRADLATQDHTVLSVPPE